MAQPSVVVAFTSRCGSTETLAHAAAVGTVNARALPRLRRLPDDGAPVPPECAATLARMQKEYVAPTDADLTNTPGLIVVPSAGMTPASEPWRPLMQTLERLSASGALAGKVGAVIDTGDPATTAAFSSALAGLGISLVSVEGAARAHGRAVGDTLAARLAQPPR